MFHSYLERVYFVVSLACVAFYFLMRKPIIIQTGVITRLVRVIHLSVGKGVDTPHKAGYDGWGEDVRHFYPSPSFA